MEDNFIAPETIDMYYSNDDTENMWEEGADRSDEIEVIRDLVPLLSPGDQKIYIDYYLLGKKQGAICKELGVVESTLSTNISRITLRLKTLALQPPIPTADEIERNLAMFRSVKARNALRLFLNNPSHTRVAKQLEMPISSVHRIVFQALTRDLEPKFHTYLKYLTTMPCHMLKMH